MSPARQFDWQPDYFFPIQYRNLSERSSSWPLLTTGDALVRLSSPSIMLWASNSNFGLAATTNVPLCCDT